MPIQPVFAIRVMFEWGGGCIWCGNEAARERFDVGPIEDRLALTMETRSRLDALSKWHDTKLDGSDPAGPSLWSREETARFDTEAALLTEAIRSELGSEFHVVYEPL